MNEFLKAILAAAGTDPSSFLAFVQFILSIIKRNPALLATALHGRVPDAVLAELTNDPDGLVRILEENIAFLVAHPALLQAVTTR